MNFASNMFCLSLSLSFFLYPLSLSVYLSTYLPAFTNESNRPKIRNREERKTTQSQLHIRRQLSPPASKQRPCFFYLFTFCDFPLFIICLSFLHFFFCLVCTLKPLIEFRHVGYHLGAFRERNKWWKPCFFFHSFLELTS